MLSVGLLPPPPLQSFPLSRFFNEPSHDPRKFNNNENALVANQSTPKSAPSIIFLIHGKMTKKKKIYSFFVNVKKACSRDFEFLLVVIPILLKEKIFLFVLYMTQQSKIYFNENILLLTLWFCDQLKKKHYLHKMILALKLYPTPFE